MGLDELWAHLSSEWEIVAAQELGKEVLAFDMDVWLYEITKQNIGCNPETNPEPFITGVLERCRRLLALDIHPVILIESHEPDIDERAFKKPGVEVCWDREERPTKDKFYRPITKCNTMLSNICSVLDALNVSYYKLGQVDVEAAAGHLEEYNKINGFVSRDHEYFLYGGKTLYQIDFDAPGDPSVVRLRSDNLLESHGLSRTRLVALGMLLGCDYQEKKIQGIGIVTALEAIGEFSISEDDHPCTILDRFRCWSQREMKDMREENAVKRKLGNINTTSLEPHTDDFARIVNAYMWPNLGRLPVDPIPDLPPRPIDEAKIKEILNRVKHGRQQKGAGSVSVSGSSTATDDTSCTSAESGQRSPRKRVSISRGASAIRNIRRRPAAVIVSCSQQEAAAWSKREWAAILALRRSTDKAFNKETTAIRGQEEESIGTKRRSSTASQVGPPKKKVAV